MHPLRIWPHGQPLGMFTVRGKVVASARKRTLAMGLIPLAVKLDRCVLRQAEDRQLLLASVFQVADQFGRVSGLERTCRLLQAQAEDASRVAPTFRFGSRLRGRRFVRLGRTVG